MANMDHNQPEALDLFERTLLDSARSDGVSAEATEQAWLRFSGLLTGAAVSVGGAHAGAQSVARLGLFSRLGVGKYLLLGALGGSALTFAWFGSQRTSQPTPTRTSAVAPTPLAVTVVAPQASSESAPALIPKAAPLYATPLRPRLVTRARSARRQEPAEPKASALSAEVAALDTARAAARAGAYERALDLLGQYQANFPTGALRADAEVASIEALDEKGDRTEAARRAARFLVQFPNDPHATALRQLLTP